VPLAWIEGPVVQGRVLLAHQDNLIEVLEGDGKKKLKEKDVRRCVDAVEMLQKSAGRLYRR